jgi:transcriptional regulator GlxA family with amidase domain
MPRLALLKFPLLVIQLMKPAKNLLEPASGVLDTAILVLPDSNTLSFASAVDPMRAAYRLAGRTLYRWQFVTTDGSPATLTSGLNVPGPPIARLDACDLLLVVAGFGLAGHDTAALRASLRRLAAAGTTVAGADGGPWLLASAGLLDGFRATTHWEDLERFADRFPAVTVLRDRFHVDGPRMTCGGALPAIDMMLHLIASRSGPGLAARVAGAFIYDRAPRPDRAQNRLGHAAHSNLTARAAALMEANLDTPLPVPQLARQLGTSLRTLESQFRRRLGTTPRAHYLELRLTEALRLVTDTDLAIVEIALATGFNAPASFARAFRAAHGTSARALRAAAG